MTDRLYRSPNDRVIAGVAGGLAAWLKVDPSIVRVAWVVLAVLTGGIFLLVYLVMMIVVPLPPPGWIPSSGPPPGQGTGWNAYQQPGGQWGAPAPGTPGSADTPGSPPQPGQWTSPPPTASPWKAPDPGNAGIVFGFILVGLGIWFLVDQYVHIDWQLVWPVIVIVIGAALILGAIRRSRPSA